MSPRWNRRDVLKGLVAASSAMFVPQQAKAGARPPEPQVEIQITPVSAFTFRLSILPANHGSVGDIPLDGSQSLRLPDVRSAADAIASNGMKDGGYIYMNIDDRWEGGRDEKGGIAANQKFGGHGAGGLRSRKGTEDRYLFFSRTQAAPLQDWVSSRERRFVALGLSASASKSESSS